MRVEPDDAEPVVARGKPLDGADVRAAAAAEHERAGRQVRGDRERLSAERVLLDDRSLRVVERKPGGLDHRLAAVAPGAWHTHEPRRERAPAGVALVPETDRDRRQRAARRALRPERAHASGLLVDDLLGFDRHADALVELRRARRILAVDAERDARHAAAIELAERVQEERAAETAPPPGTADAERADMAAAVSVRLVAARPPQSRRRPG